MSNQQSLKSTFKPAARRKARHYGMQALYQWQMTKNALADIESQFLNDYDFSNVDGEYFQELVFNIPACVSELDAVFSGFLQERNIEELDPIELALLRIGCYELVKRIDIPYKVSINEAVSLAKKFGAAESHKYINAVLDRVSQQVREVEVNATKR